MRGTWQVLNRIINKTKKQNCMPEHFTCNNKRIVNKKDIANGFNNFFVNVGPQLAKKSTVSMIEMFWII